MVLPPFSFLSKRKSSPNRNCFEHNNVSRQIVIQRLICRFYLSRISAESLQADRIRNCLQLDQLSSPARRTVPCAFRTIYRTAERGGNDLSASPKGNHYAIKVIHEYTPYCQRVSVPKKLVARIRNRQQAYSIPFICISKIGRLSSMITLFRLIHHNF